MSRTPQVTVRAAQHYAGIKETVTMDTIGPAVDRAFPELFGWLGGQGITPAGPPFIRFLVIDMAADLEVDFGVPVASPVTAGGRVQPGVLPGGRYLVLRHAGPYDQLIGANAELQDWAEANGVSFERSDTPRGSAWPGRIEQYLTDPSTEPDPSKWQTDIAYLIRG